MINATTKHRTAIPTIPPPIPPTRAPVLSAPEDEEELEVAEALIVEPVVVPERVTV